MLTIIRSGAAAPRAAAAPPRARRRPRWNVETLAVVLLLLAAWQAASTFLPPLFFPSLQRIAGSLLALVSSPDDLAATGLTFARILAFVGISFVLATAAGIASGVQERVERAALPFVQLMQAVPAVCWVIFAILWFREIDVRIGFVVVVSSVPVFFYQARDAVRAIPATQIAMMRVLNPTPLQMLTKLTLPALVPAMLTAWRISLGNGTRITITAELLSGISGIGYQLRNAQEQFRMDQAIAWTILLVVFVLIGEAALTRIEGRLLHWRNVQ
jgi:NitT/TauT family transport system permease protein